MLAYITPEEGDVLQSLGGSGAPGPMGIPSYFADDDEDEAAEVSEHSADAAGMGQAGADDPAAVADPVGIANGLGITDKNPFGRNVPGFIQGLSNIFGPLDYSNIFSQQQMDDIRGKHLGVTMNPNNVPGVIGFDINQVPNQPRSGIQKGFGSLFGRPTGQMTTLGPIAAQRSGKPMDAIALSGFNALAGLSLPGIISNIVGPAQSYAVKGSIGYDPTKDPALAGNKGLGTLADVISMNLTGNTTAGLQDAYTGISSIASDMLGNVADVTSAVEDAISFGYNPKGGSVGSVVNDKGYTSSISNYNPNMNDNEGGENRIERPRPTGDPSPIERAPVVGEDFIDPELLKYIKRRPAAPVSEVGYNQDLTASSSSKPIDFSSFDRGLGSLQSGITAINRNR